MAYTFRGGIHPNYKKNLSSHKPIEILPAPERIILPLSMHSGVPCKPIIKVGDIVDMGQKIADSDAFVSAPVHSSVSGRVTEIAPMPNPCGSKVMSIIIENDFEDRLSFKIKPKETEGKIEDELIAVIREAGIVGLGGAMFPTHVKIKSGLGKVDTIIINGAECEPYITSDHRTLLEYPEEIIGGTEIIMKIYGLNKVKLAIEKNKYDVFPLIRKLLSKRKDIEICVLETKYPQGAEKQLINALTEREVPSGGLPADIGVAVFNINTAAAVFRAFSLGMPLIERVVTVSGSAVPNPKNLRVRIGTPLSHLIDMTGGFKEEPVRMIMGGPMMGVAQFDLNAPVIKGTNAFLAFHSDEDKTAKNPVCIRCGKCVSVCPINLLPTYMHMYAEKGDIAECEKLGVLDCIECGACSFECPGRLYLVQSFRMAKQRIMDSRKKGGAL